MFRHHSYILRGLQAIRQREARFYERKKQQIIELKRNGFDPSGNDEYKGQLPVSYLVGNKVELLLCALSAGVCFRFLKEPHAHNIYARIHIFVLIELN
jgi:hypothetical protein